MCEDTALGLVFYCSLGRWSNPPMPIAEGLIAIASGIGWAIGGSLLNLSLKELRAFGALVLVGGSFLALLRA